MIFRFFEIRLEKEILTTLLYFDFSAGLAETEGCVSKL
jgi:hypothetical protein